MALSNAEKQKRYRERKAARAAAQSEPKPAPVKRSFAEFIESVEERVQAMDDAFTNLNALASAPWEEHVARPDAAKVLGEYVGDDFDGAVMSLRTIAALVNEYRAEQIDAQLLELGQARHENDTLKQAADQFAERLRKVRRELGRANRYEFPPMRVAGD